eukprot:1839720-Pyramimonas_sp.AAC.1
MCDVRKENSADKECWLWDCAWRRAIFGPNLNGLCGGAAAFGRLSGKTASCLTPPRTLATSQMTRRVGTSTGSSTAFRGRIRTNKGERWQTSLEM